MRESSALDLKKVTEKEAGYFSERKKSELSGRE